MTGERDLIEHLRHHGLKVTPQRHLICRLIAENPGAHPTAEMIYEQAVRVMPTLSRKTIYTTVNELAEIGAVRLTRLGTEPLRVDLTLTPHAHGICRGCGKVVDIPLDSAWKPVEVQNDVPFHVESCEVIYQGLCSSCGSRNGSGELNEGGKE